MSVLTAFGTCARCGLSGELNGRRLHDHCYSASRRDGTVDNYPLTSRAAPGTVPRKRLRPSAISHLRSAGIAPFDCPPDYAGTDTFFPLSKAQEAEAVAVCRTCPFQQACAKWALDTRQEWGVYGATTETERRAIFRQQAKQRRAGVGV